MSLAEQKAEEAEEKAEAAESQKTEEKNEQSSEVSGCDKWRSRLTVYYISIRTILCQ